MSDRDLTLDFVKGILVISMVIYHTMNYFTNAEANDYAYIRWITGSFIFISGFVVATFYEKKYKVNPKRVTNRLLIRGIKLLILFTVLNLAINIMGFSNYKQSQFSLQQFLNNLNTIYLSGNSSVTAFQILVPISYILIFSPIFFIFDRSRNFLSVSTMLVAFFYEFFSIDSYNIYLIIIGLIGVSVGNNADIHKLFFIKNKYKIIFFFFIIINMMRIMNKHILCYSIGVIIVLKLFYDFGKTVNLKRNVYQKIILLGQYSLMCYTVQIVFLHLLRCLLSKPRWDLGVETIIIFFITNLFLVRVCIFINFCRKKYNFLDKTYKFIF